MKKTLNEIGTGYIVIGGLFGAIQWFSYIWMATFGFKGESLIGHMSAATTGIFLGNLSGLVRSVFWLPSILIWSQDPHHGTLLHWMTSGLGMNLISH